MEGFMYVQSVDIFSGILMNTGKIWCINYRSTGSCFHATW